MFRVDHSLDIYGPDYSQSESTSAHNIVALIPWKNENQTFDFIKPFLSSQWCIWGFANWNCSKNWSWAYKPAIYIVEQIWFI